MTIIGGGAMGVSTAYHLAQRGVGSILVIERDLLGSGSSAKPLGGVEQRSRIQATSCWRNASLKRTSDSQASSGSTSAFDKSDTCSSDAGQSPGFGRAFSHEWLAAFDKAAAVVAPALVGLKVEAGWAGLYENTPDHNALIGRAHVPRNFLYATGFSGHGFLQAPAVGELITDLFLERDSFMDPHPFRADRFGDAEALSEVHII